MYANYHPPSHWSPAPPRQSTYQAAPFAQSVVQHTSPSASYPTPPPPGMSASSSSLANALGAPSSKPAHQVYQPEDSPAFFNAFLGHTPIQPLPRAATAPQTVRYHQQPPPLLHIQPPQPSQAKQSRVQPIPLADIPLVDLGSPDPLGISKPGSDSLQVTPRKRKIEQYLESHSIKRMQTTIPNRETPSPLQPRGHQQQQKQRQQLQLHQSHRHQQAFQSQQRQQPQHQQAPPRPQVSRRQLSFEIVIPTSSKQKPPPLAAHSSSQHRSALGPSSSGSSSAFSSGSSSQPYIAVPPHPKAYHTPTSQKKERLEVVITTTKLSAKGKGKLKTSDDDDDLGGFGSEEDSTPHSFGRSSTSKKSSVRRATGDRDDRGKHAYSSHVRDGLAL